MDKIPWYEKYKVSLPEKTIGAWSIELMEVSADDAAFANMRSAFAFGGGGRHIPPGTYTSLKHNRYLWMSDTPAEIRGHLDPIHEAAHEGGHVLINGLGIGMVAGAILAMENVEKVTIIELSPEVIELVGPSLTEKYGDRVEIIQADAYEYKPPRGMRYSVVWHDIWADLCTDNLDGMGKLHRKYGRRCEWQGSWEKRLLQSHRRREKASRW
jgi:hypothetical protein